METLIESLINGIANAWRGSGLKGGKILTVVLMMGSAYYALPSYWFAGLFPLPLLLFWWKKGGTGSSHKAILSWFHIPYLREDLQWRAFEFTSVFLYSLIVLSIANNT